MRPTIEHGFPRCMEIYDYYMTGNGTTATVEQAYLELKSWFDPLSDRYLVGRGGHHVFVHDKAINARVFVGTEE